ncbi:MAG: outer membrane protein, partial [Hyphomonas sp.]
MQKLILAAAVAALGIPSAAQAQTHDWSGWYAGANIGKGDKADFDLSAELQISPTTTFFPAPLAGGTFPTNRTFSGDGTVGGLQGGYNFQQGMLVFGGEADINLSDVGTSISIPGAPGGAANNPDGFTDLAYGVDYYSTARARAGLAFGRFLPYATAGLAIGKVEFDRNYRVGANQVTDSASSTRTGSTYGAGLDVALTDRMSVGAEYSKIDLGSDSFDTSYSDGTIGRATIDRPTAAG